MKKFQIIPLDDTRLETGPMQFSDDWLGYALALRRAVERRVEIDSLAKLADLVELLGSCRVRQS